MSSSYVTVEDRGAVGLIRVDRAPANALDVALLNEIPDTLEAIAGSDAKGLVITGREGFFSAGADLKVVPTLDSAGQRAMVTGINRLFATLYSLERPLIAAVNGHAIAGGLILALCADYRVGSTEGRLGLTELRAGLPYPAVALAVVRAELSPQATRILTLGADLVDPQRALELGALDELAAPDAVLERALTVAEEFATLPASAYTQVKRQVRGDTIERCRRVVEDADDPLLDAWLGEETTGAASGILER